MDKHWRRTRWKCGLGLVIFVPFTVLGLLAIAGGERGVGVGVALGFGLLSIGCGQVAFSGRRGTDAVRLVQEDGRFCVEFPAHRAAAVVSLVFFAGIVAFFLAPAVYWTGLALEGDVVAGVGAVLAGAFGGYLAWLAARSRGGRRGWPAVRLSEVGVGITSLSGTAVVPWELEPVAVPMPNNVLRVMPVEELFDLADSAGARFKDAFRSNRTSVGGLAIDADLRAIKGSVDFYRDRPDRRAELSSLFGVERIRSGELTAADADHRGR